MGGTWGLGGGGSLAICTGQEKYGVKVDLNSRAGGGGGIAGFVEISPGVSTTISIRGLLTLVSNLFYSYFSQTSILDDPAFSQAKSYYQFGGWRGGGGGSRGPPSEYK